MIPELVKVFTSTESRHVQEVVSSAQEGGARSAFFPALWPETSRLLAGLAMVALMAHRLLLQHDGSGDA